MASADFYLHPAKYREEPFHIFGELYYVGDKNVCSYLLDTGEGLILIDTAYPTTQALLIDSIYHLGFDPRNVRKILHTHGHFDHFGCTEFIQSLSGAELYLSRADSKMFRERPELSMCDVNAPFRAIELFRPDTELSEGDEVCLGTVKIRVLETPGHTDGVLTYLLELHEDGRTCTAALFGGIGLVTMKSGYAKKWGLLDYRAKFRASIKKLRGIHPDITLANHCSQGPFMRNRREDKGFIHPKDWQVFLDECQASLDRLEQEDPLD